MATKRLRRTVIEGGRDGWSKRTRRWSHRDERAMVREVLVRVREDPSAWDDMGHPRRPKAYKSFADKLAPAARWLAKRAGRPWRDVEGEILATFDTRTLAGRHIVYDHLLPDQRYWDRALGWRVGRYGFVVDGHGFLRVDQRRRRSQRCTYRGTYVRPEIAAWIGERRIGARGARAYWMTPSTTEAVEGRRFYRQGRELDEAELQWLRVFTESEREQLVITLSGGPPLSGTNSD